MANWGNILSGGNVEDRRSSGPAILGGGLSLGGIALVILYNVLSGATPEELLNQLQNTAVEPQNSITSQEFDGQDSYEQFTAKVLGSNNQMWSAIFSRSNQTYQEPTLVLFRTATESGCGTATSEVGPHYCPNDATIYLDETFFNELTTRFGAGGGDVAEAYVIAHEVGHHVQNQLGIIDKIGGSNFGSGNSGSRSNDLSVRMELQADCFAGLWVNSLKDQNVLEPNEVHEAMDAAAAVGDDRIQSKVTGQINPERWTHGSSAQRVEWFDKGYTTGSVAACDTFK